MKQPSVKKESSQSPSFLSLPDERRIAYHKSEGAEPCILFMGGFKSDMTGSRALALEAFCQNRKQAFIRFDYSGHGQSSGHFEDGTIGSWLQDALDVLDQLGGKRNILVGSSMGGWIMLLAALAQSEKVSALLGVASAPDFTERLIWQQMTREQKQAMEKDDKILLPSCDGEDPYPITRQLIEEGRRHLLLEKPIPIHVPVRLIHGMNDEDVPWETSVMLCKQLMSNDVRIKLVKGGGHRMSEPAHLDIITRILHELLIAIS